MFYSPHIISSPNTRRSLQHRSSSLSLTGFAKVGYPGVIYVKGYKKLRFVEPSEYPKDMGERQWIEFQKLFRKWKGRIC